MYICLEGVKGSGKSTLLQNIVCYFEQKNKDFEVASPTKPTPKNVWWEVLFKNFPFLKKIDTLKQKLYIQRANWVAKHTNWTKKMVIGDRSIITSYVTRWQKWDNPTICVNKIDVINTMPAPDYVLYLDISLDAVMKRLQNRVRDYGKEDETPQKVTADMQAYHDLKNGKYEVKRLKNTTWIGLNAELSPENLLKQAIEIIENLEKKHFL